MESLNTFRKSTWYTDNEQQNEFHNLLCIFQELPKTFSLHQGKSMSNRLSLGELDRSYFQTQQIYRNNFSASTQNENQYKFMTKFS